MFEGTVLHIGTSVGWKGTREQSLRKDRKLSLTTRGSEQALKALHVEVHCAEFCRILHVYAIELNVFQPTWHSGKAAGNGELDSSFLDQH